MKSSESLPLEWFCFFVATAIYLFQALIFFPLQLDDPYITFRYSKNFADGVGILWNAGEAPVEGYTTMLWMFMGALAIKLGIYPILAAKIIGILSALILIWAMIFKTSRWLTNPIDRIACAVLLSFSADLAFHSVSAMENVTFVTVLFFACLSFLKAVEEQSSVQMGMAAIFTVILCLLRPEGHFFVFAGSVILLAYSRGQSKNLVLFLGVILVVLLPVHAIRFMYYGSLLPNTYLAKHTGAGIAAHAIEALIYIANTFPAYGVYLFAAALYFSLKEQRNTFDWLMGLLIAIYFLYVFNVGGDDRAVFPGCRLLLPIVPFLILITCRFIESFQSSPKRKLYVYLSIGVLFIIFQSPMIIHHKKTLRIRETKHTSFSALLERAKQHWQFLKNPTKLEISNKFLQETPKGESIAIPWAGRIPYETMLSVIDTAGINDLHIARTQKKDRGILVKSDPDYVIGRNPYLLCDIYGGLRDYSVEQISQMSEAELMQKGVRSRAGIDLMKNPGLLEKYQTDPSFNQHNHLICFRRK